MKNPHSPSSQYSPTMWTRGRGDAWLEHTSKAEQEVDVDTLTRWPRRGREEPWPPLITRSTNEEMKTFLAYPLSSFLHLAAL
jgi:hypothetical protein